MTPVPANQNTIDLGNKIAEQAKEIASLKEQIEEMQEDVRFLKYLRYAGVDNWEGYEYAIDMMRDEE